MTEQELDQIAAEIQELAQKSHWLAISPFSYVSEMGYVRKPDTMRFPATPQGLQEALAWLRQQAAITWIQPGEQDAG